MNQAKQNQLKKNRHLDNAAVAVILRNTDWLSLLSGKNGVDEMVTSFMAVIDSTIPFIQRQGMAKHNKGQSTLPKHIHKLIHKKRKLWKRLQRYHPTDPITDCKFSDFAAARKAVKKAIYGFRCDEPNKLADCKNKSQFHRYINRHVKTKSSIYRLISNNGSEAESDFDKAQLLNTTFASNFISHMCLPYDYESTNCGHSCNGDGFQINVTYDDVLRVLNVPPGAADPDGLTSDIIRKIAPFIARPMFIIYQQSAFTGKFLSQWKCARIAPIYKGKGSRDDPNSYRPVSLCNILGKCLERLVNFQLMEYVEKNNFLSSVQHGFRTGRSTITNLLATDKYIADWVNGSIPFDIVSFDMSKTFDRVPHDFITKLLCDIGFHENTVKWFQDFLSGRTQFVQLDSSASQELPVTSGIIQGSVAGPLLRALFINQLAKRLKVPSSLFANDFKVLINLNEITTDAAQSEIDVFTNWYDENRGIINTEKSCCLHSSGNDDYHYRCGNVIIPNAKSFKDLGVVRSADGGYDLHTDYAASKAQQISAAMLRNIIIPNHAIGWRLFQVSVQPCLQYGSNAWNPMHKGASDVIESIQWRYTKRLRGFKSLS